MAKKFNIDAQLHRFEGKSKHRSLFWTRSYARLETAARRAIEYFMIEGEVGDLIVFSLKKNGMEVGVAKFTVTGHVIINWNTDEVKRLVSVKMKTESRKTAGKE